MRVCRNSFSGRGGTGRESFLTKKSCRGLFRLPEALASAGSLVGNRCGVRELPLFCTTASATVLGQKQNSQPLFFVKKDPDRNFPKQQNGPSAKQGSRLLYICPYSHFFQKSRAGAREMEIGMGGWKKKQGGKNATLSEGFLLVASRRVLLTLNTYGNRSVPHMDHDFDPSRRAWRPDDAVSHGCLTCPMSSSTFCGALTPKHLSLCSWTCPTALL